MASPAGTGGDGTPVHKIAALLEAQPSDDGQQLRAPVHTTNASFRPAMARHVDSFDSLPGTVQRSKRSDSASDPPTTTAPASSGLPSGAHDRRPDDGTSHLTQREGRCAGDVHANVPLAHLCCQVTDYVRVVRCCSHAYLQKGETFQGLIRGVVVWFPPRVASPPAQRQVMTMAQCGFFRGGDHDKLGLGCCGAAGGRRAGTGRLVAAYSKTSTTRLPPEACSEERHACVAVRLPAWKLATLASCAPCLSHQLLVQEHGFPLASLQSCFEMN